MSVSPTSVARLQKTRSRKSLSLQQELIRLRSLVIGLAGVDEEGAYRPEFVEQTLNASEEKAQHTFTDSDSFLRHLRSV